MIQIRASFTLLLICACSVLLAQHTENNSQELDVRHHALKTNFLSPAANYHVELIYERGMKQNRNLELGLGIIGLGDNPEVLFSISEDRQFFPDQEVVSVDVASSKGAFGRVGYKFMNFMQSEFSNDVKHPFSGEYIRPEFILGGYGVDVTRLNEADISSTSTESRMFGAFIINVGAQGVIADILLFDLYVGAGYGSETSGDYVGNYAFYLGEQTDGFGLCLRGGIGLGILLN